MSQAEVSDWRCHHRGESTPASTYNENHPLAIESKALFEWFDDRGVMRAVEQYWHELGEDDCADNDREWEIIDAKAREIDSQENLRGFLLHMLERCPWLAQEWPGSDPGTDRAIEPGFSLFNGHSDDFTTVGWRSETFTFNRTQAKVIGLFAEQARKVSGSPPTLRESWIGAQLDATADYRLRNTFRVKGGRARQHPAWGRMIVGGAVKGTYRLEPART